MDRSDFWVTIPFNFEQLVCHCKQFDWKSISTAVPKKDESFKWEKFHRNRSYHSNIMTSPPILHETDFRSWSWLDIVFSRSAKFEKFLLERFQEDFGWSFEVLKYNKNKAVLKRYWENVHMARSNNILALSESFTI